MAPEVGVVNGDDDLVARSGLDLVIAAGASVVLCRHIGRDVADLEVADVVCPGTRRAGRTSRPARRYGPQRGNAAHASSSATTTMATTTITMSDRRLTRVRKGFRPMRPGYWWPR